MRQHLRAVSAVVVLLVGLACAGEPEQESSSDATVPAPTAQQATVVTPLQDIPCTERRDPVSASISPRGDTLVAPYAAVFFPHGSYPMDTTVTMKPSTDVHGVSLSPAPNAPVLIGLRIGFCGEDADKSDYSIAYDDGATTIPAARVELKGTWWAVVMVPPDAWKADTTGTLIRGGFVVLSN